MHGAEIPFKTTNYGLTTTPKDEFKIASGAKKCPEDQMLDKEGKCVRVIKMIEDLQREPLAKE